MKYFNRNTRVQAMALSTVMLVSAGLSGCTGEEVAQTIGAIAIIGGAVAIGANSECQGGYKDVCHDFRDYWGNLRTECRQEYDSCRYRVPRKDRDERRRNQEFSALEQAEAAVALLDADSVASDAASAALSYETAEAAVTPVKWGNRFGISFDASKEFIDAMKAAKAGDSKAIENLGLGADDLENLASQKMPSEGAIDAVALSLKQDREAIRGMIAQLLVQAQDPEVQAAAAQK